MKMLNAWTMEADDPAVALSELLEQLDIENSLFSNSAGFITCSYDYVETGMLKVICEAFPFDVVGCTTFTNANNEQSGTMLLCLTVLTADDCQFETVLTPPLTGDLQSTVDAAFAGALSGDKSTPGVVFAFLPMIRSIGAEIILSALDKTVKGAPIFGTTACDFDTAFYSNSFTIHNGECTRDCLSVLLVRGNVNPHFVVTATSEQNLHQQQAIITSSEGSILKEVNGMNAGDYFNSIGLLQSNGIEGISSVPFVVNYNDGTQPVARAIYSLDEDGSAVCGGFMPEGGTLSIGRMDVDDILLTAEQSLDKLLAYDNLCGIITFPCLGRNMVLGVNPFAEVEKVREVIGDRLPWHLAYSGGEVCPVYSENGTAINRFHNFTFIACAL